MREGKATCYTEKSKGHIYAITYDILQVALTTTSYCVWCHEDHNWYCWQIFTLSSVLPINQLIHIISTKRISSCTTQPLKQPMYAHHDSCHDRSLSMTHKISKTFNVMWLSTEVAFFTIWISGKCWQLTFQDWSLVQDM